MDMNEKREGMAFLHDIETNMDDYEMVWLKPKTGGLHLTKALDYEPEDSWRIVVRSAACMLFLQYLFSLNNRVMLDMSIHPRKMVSLCVDVDDDTTMNQLCDKIETIVRRDSTDVNASQANAGTFRRSALLCCNLETDIKDIQADMIINIDTTQTSFLQIGYNNYCHTPESMLFLYENLLSLFFYSVENVDTPLKQFAWLDDTKRQAFDEAYQKTEKSIAGEQTLQAVFEAQVIRSPEAPAVLCGAKTLSYYQLNGKANTVAHSLLDRGIGPGYIVGIMMDRSLEMIIAIYAIMKTGAAYLPIDPKWPDQRIKHVLDESNTKHLLTITSLCPLQLDKYEIIYLSEAQILERDDNPQKQCQAEDPAYIIYTSGSTGDPKGVIVEHLAVINRLRWMQAKYPLTKADRILFKTAYTFDVSVWEIFWWSFAGAGVYCLKQGAEKDPNLIARCINEYNVTVIHFVPSMLHAFLDTLDLSDINKCKSLRYIFSSGEALDKYLSMLLYKRFASEHTTLINLYGPTEAAIDVTYHECIENDQRTVVPIGKPIDNIKLYIMDGQHMCKQGCWGELCISGMGLARGYLNQPLTTQSSFQNHPQLGRIYRTGDICRWTYRGDVEYLCRQDSQVKIRGFRIELDEIRFTFLKHPYVENAAVLVGDRAGTKYIIAFCTVQAHIQTDKGLFENLREYAAKYLPSYMVPSDVVVIDALPTTGNGKLDARELLSWYYTNKTKKEQTGVCNESGVSTLHQDVLSIWQEFLVKSEIGMGENFLEIGGDSILALAMVNAVNERFSARLRIQDVYSDLTIDTIVGQLKENPPDTVSMEREKGLLVIEHLKQTILSDAEQVKRIPMDCEDIYPTSKIQQGMLLHTKIRQTEPVYHDQFLYYIRFKKLIPSLLQEALGSLMLEHTILRTTFNLTDFSSPLLLVMRNINASVEWTDLKGLARGEQEIKIEQYLKDDLTFTLIVDNMLPWRLHTFHIEKDEYLMVLSFHHAILDGWSVAYLVTQLVERYYKLADGQFLIPSPLKSSYKDCVAIELGKAETSESRQFWENYMRGYERNRLPFYASRLKDEPVPNDIEVVDLGEELHAQIVARCPQMGVSIKELFMAAYVVLLAIITGENDVVAGIVSHNRPSIPDSDKIIGCFLNTLPIRIRVENGMLKQSLFLDIRQYERSMKTYELFLSNIVEATGETFSSANPFFDVILNYIDFHVLNILRGQSNIEEHYNELNIKANEMTNTILDYEVSRTMNHLSIRAKFSPNFFLSEDIKYSLELYRRLIIHLIDIDDYIDTEKIITDEEQHFLLHEFNNTEFHYSKDILLHQLFERQVNMAPENTALVASDGSLSYAQLNDLANQFAWGLAAAGVKAGDRVAVVEVRNTKMIAMLLGILKAGCVYVPISTNYDSKRVAYILQSAQVKMLICEKAVEFSVNSSTCTIILAQDLLAYGNDPAVLTEPKPNDLAYIIYTSGSTGQPKGVMIENSSAVNLVCWVNHRFSINKEDTLLFITSICFDLSVYDIFGMLAAGGKIILAESEQINNPQTLSQLLIDHRVTIWDSVPTTISGMISYLEETGKEYRQTALRLVLLSGDWIPVSLADRIKSYFVSAQTISLGGATEGCVWSIYYPVGQLHQRRSVPYGRPIGNNTFYILDSSRRLLPPGAPGELYIGGVGVARGYAGDIERTSKAFFPNMLSDETRGTIYRTGDMGRMLPDGVIEFLGRKDFQVKVRGYRIELEEVEGAAITIDGIYQAVVLKKEDRVGNAFLCLYYVASQPLPAVWIKTELMARLPKYMTPDAYVHVERLPLNTNQKIDRNKLIEMEDTHQKLESVKPASTETQRKLTQIWKDLLQIDTFSTDDSFFDIGGNSLLILKMLGRVEREFSMTLNAAQLFSYSTIEALAQLIDGNDSGPIRLSGTSVRPDFYASDSYSGSVSIYKVQLDSALGRAQKLFAEIDKISIMHILTGLYAFTIREVTQDDHVIFYVTDSGSSLIQCEVDFLKIEDYRDLFVSIRDSYTKSDKIAVNRISAKPATQDCFISAFISVSGQTGMLTPKQFDIICAYKVSAEGMVLEIKCDPLRISQDRAAEILSAYCQLADAMLAEYGETMVI